jgi:hypothetical protein
MCVILFCFVFLILSLTDLYFMPVYVNTSYNINDDMHSTAGQFVKVLSPPTLITLPYPTLHTKSIDILYESNSTIWI